MTHVTCRPTAKNWDQLPNPTLGNRVWATLAFFGLTSGGGQGDRFWGDAGVGGDRCDIFVGYKSVMRRDVGGAA